MWVTISVMNMKTFSLLTIALTLIAFSGCTSATRKHMRIADVLLLQSEEKMASGDWAEATAIANQTMAEVKTAIEARPVRKGANGEQLDITPMFDAWVNGPHKELLGALEEKQSDRAKVAYEAIRQQCTSCHQAVGRNNIPIDGIQ